MPFRERLRSALLRRPSPKPPGEPTIVKPPALDAQSPQAKPSIAVQTVLEDPKPHSQRLELHGCWREAYELVQEEYGDLIHAYEKFLLQQGSDDHAVQAGSHPLSHLRSVVERRLQEIEKSRLRITVAGKEIVVREQARHAIHAILSVKDFITAAVSTEPHAALAWAGALLLLNPIVKSVTQDEDAMSAFEDISITLVRYRLIERTHIEIYSQESGTSKRPPEELEASVRSQTVKMYARILEFQIRLAQHYRKTGFYRFLDDLGFSDDWKELLQPITSIDKQIIDQLNVLSQHTLKDMHLEVGKLQRRMEETLDLLSQVKDETRETKQIQLLNTLPVSSGAGFDSEEDEMKSRCLEGTQVTTLGRIQEWCQSPTSESIYWLKGMAGTGKSTISRTVATAFHGRHSLLKGTPAPERLCLGGSFFFDQGKADRSTTTKLFTTLCKQLATSLPGTRDEICKAISNNPDIGNQGMKDQWNNLILQPLLSLERQTLLAPFTLVIVIDALDECDKSKIETLLARFTQLQGLHTIQLKIFITSRPEAHIFTAFREMEGRCEIHEDNLHKVKLMVDSNNKDDITRFLTLEMATACNKHSLPSDWPGETTINKLASKADGLWIYAATTCRFIQEAGLTQRQLTTRLDLVLEEDTTGMTPQHNLDEIYRRILKFSIGHGATDREIEDACRSFREIVGCIVVLFQPLTKAALSDFLSIDPLDVEDTLNSLSSVLSINEDQKDTVKLLHLSFCDFLIKEDRCSDSRFRVCPKTAHYRALVACLKTLSDRLRENFYSISHPSSGSAEVDHSKAPVHVHYAILYWVDHLRHSGSVPDDGGEVHRFLKCHFLHWIEFMSASCKMSEAVSAVMSLNEYLSTLPTKENTEVRDFIQDARRFILKSRAVIEAAPLQIYRSALMYSPEWSIIRQQFQYKIPSLYTRLPVVDMQWSALIQTFENPGSCSDVAFSPDGKLVASQSARIWDVTTGTLLKSFEPLRTGASVTFSPDGKCLLYLSEEGNLRVWDLAKDQVQQEVEHSLDFSNFSVFSQDKTMVACAYRSRVQLIDVVNGRALEPFRNFFGATALALSSDGQLLGYGSDLGTIHFLDTRTFLQKELRVKEAEEYCSCSCIVFSADKKMVATLHESDSPSSSTMQIWDLATERPLHKIKIDRAWDLVFLPDNKTLISGGNRVHIWEIASGRLLRTIDAQCIGLVLSSDGKLLTKSDDADEFSLRENLENLQMWDVATGALLRDIEVNKSRGLLRAVFSPDNSTLAIALNDEILLWDLTTQSMPEYKNPSDQASGFTGIVLSPSQRTLAATKNDMVGLLDLNTERFSDLVELYSTLEVPYYSDAVDSIYHNWQICQRRKDGSAMFKFIIRATFSPDGESILTSYTMQSKLWNVETRQLTWIIDHGLERSVIWQFSPDGALLAHGFQREDHNGVYAHLQDHHKVDRVGEAAIWDVRKQTLLHRLNRPYQTVKGLAFSPDGSILACILKDAQPESPTEPSVLEICDVAKGLVCRARSAPADLQFPLVWSPDGEIIACYSSTGFILFFCSESARLHSSLFAGKSYSPVLAFSPDGKLLASIIHDLTDPVRGQTKRLFVWEIDSHTLLGTQEMLIDNLYRDDVWFSEDGKTIHTHLGRIDVRAFDPVPKRHQDLFLNKDWIRYGENEAMLLPYEHRARRAVAVGNTLMTEHHTGQITFFGFGDS